MPCSVWAYHNRSVLCLAMLVATMCAACSPWHKASTPPPSVPAPENPNNYHNTICQNDQSGWRAVTICRIWGLGDKKDYLCATDLFS